jgi:hypothetical protein
VSVVLLLLDCWQSPPSVQFPLSTDLKQPQLASVNWHILVGVLVIGLGEVPRGDVVILGY